MLTVDAELHLCKQSALSVEALLKVLVAVPFATLAKQTFSQGAMATARLHQFATFLVQALPCRFSHHSDMAASTLCGH
jgi:hypothetical protein